MQAQAESSSLRDEVSRLRLDCKETGHTDVDLRLKCSFCMPELPDVSRLEECAALRAEMSQSEVGRGSCPA